MSDRQLLPLKDLRIDGGTQMRAEFNDELIADIAAAVKNGDTIPDAIVFFDGIAYWLADGFHRRHGFERAGKKSMPCEVRQGSQREAILYAAGCNDKHGQRRSNADKRKAVEAILADDEWSKASDRWIAEQCRVGHPLVASIRNEIGEKVSQDVSTGISSTSDNGASHNSQNGTPTRTGKDGKQHPATKPAKVLCDGCKRKERVGQPLPKNCPACVDLNPKKKREKVDKTAPSGDKDIFGNDVPKRCRDALCDPWIVNTLDLLGTALDKILAARIADGMKKRAKRYPFYQEKDVVEGIRFIQQYMDQVLEHLKDNRPQAVCPACGGKGCPECRQSGLVSKDLYKKLQKVGATK